MTNPATAGAIIFAKDPARVARFYEKISGLSVVQSEAGHIVLACGALELVIHAIPASIAADIVVGDPPDVREETPIKLFLAVPSLTAARTQAADLGGRLAPEDREWSAPGYRACDGIDPEGNVVQFREITRQDGDGR